MTLTIKQYPSNRILWAKSEDQSPLTLPDIIDALGNAHYQGLRIVGVQKECLGQNFFDLQTGVAGEILQKFSNYGLAMVIAGDFQGDMPRSLRDFIRESNATGRVVFSSTFEEGLALIKG